MKLSFAINVLATTPLFASAAVQRELREFMSEGEIQRIFGAVSDYPSNVEDAPLWAGGITPPDLVERLVNETPINFRRSLGGLDNDGNPPFQIKTMRETTDVHVDMDDEEECIKSSQPQETSTLMFLNTNEDAFFLHGDQAIPVEAGKLVNFRADEPHQTVVNSGHVQILVPFTHRELMPHCAGPCEAPPLGCVASSLDEVTTEDCYCDVGDGDFNPYPIPGLCVDLVWSNEEGRCPDGQTCNGRYTAGKCVPTCDTHADCFPYGCSDAGYCTNCESFNFLPGATVCPAGYECLLSDVSENGPYGDIYGDLSGGCLGDEFAFDSICVCTAERAEAYPCECSREYRAENPCICDPDGDACDKCNDIPGYADANPCECDSDFAAANLCCDSDYAAANRDECCFDDHDCNDCQCIKLQGEDFGFCRANFCMFGIWNPDAGEKGMCECFGSEPCHDGFCLNTVKTDPDIGEYQICDLAKDYSDGVFTSNGACCLCPGEDPPVGSDPMKPECDFDKKDCWMGVPGQCRQANTVCSQAVHGVCPAGTTACKV